MRLWHCSQIKSDCFLIYFISVENSFFDGKLQVKQTSAIKSIENVLVPVTDSIHIKLDRHNITASCSYLLKPTILTDSSAGLKVPRLGLFKVIALSNGENSFTKIEPIFYATSCSALMAIIPSAHCAVIGVKHGSCNELTL